MSAPGTCPHCGAGRKAGQYLCRTGWFGLTPEARARLRKRDLRASTRLLELYRQISDEVPLSEIEVSP